MADAYFAIPGDIKSPTGGYAYDRRVIEMLPAFGVNVQHLALASDFPNPSKADIADAISLVAETPDDATVLFDGLAFGAIPQDRLTLSGRRIIAVVHHPLYLETGLAHARKVELKASEAAALERADHIVVTSRTTARILRDELGVDRDKITVAEPGTDPAQRATGTGAPLHILAVGAVSPRKNYESLIEALSALKDIDWKLTIAGAIDRHPACVDSLRERIAEEGLSERVTLSGKVVPATLDRFYDSTDLFVSASLFEGYGMVIAEAMARGLPIVTTTGGAAADTAHSTAALHVQPGNTAEMAAALRKALSDKRVRDKLADASWEIGRTLPTWHETARRIAAVILGLKA
ncbi:MAG: glycosyltransferase family 4 protein [Hyphomicrobium sp.]